MKLFLARFVSVLAVFSLSSCSSLPGDGQNALKIGMTPDIAPILYKQAGEWTGLEVDLAVQLGKALGHPIEIVQLAWDDQIPALIEGRTDIIMSGMTVTDARKIRIAFSTPWLESGLMALIRAKDKDRLKTPEDLAASSGKIGVMPGTTGDAFVQRHYHALRSVSVSDPEDVAFLMQRRSIESFVHDAPSILWQVSRHEADLTVIPQLLNREQIAWGVRRNDTDLLNSVNAVIARWQADGTLDATIRRWIPYYDRLLTAEPAASPKQ